MIDKLKLDGVQVRIRLYIDDCFYLIEFKRENEKYWVNYGVWGSTGLLSEIRQLYR